jgi:hypothetical protein
MIGCVATASPEGETINVADPDVNEVAWFSKEEARAMLDNHVYGAANDPKNMALPGPYAIAFHLVADFVEGKYDSVTPPDGSGLASDWSFTYGCGVGVALSVVVGAAGYLTYLHVNK